VTATLVAKNLVVVRGSTTLLNDVSLEVRAGELVAVLGPNGAGKSTLLGAVAGDFPLASGSVTLNGNNINKLASNDLARVRAVFAATNFNLVPVHCSRNRCDGSQPVA
jgi:ABC-type cobalamin/Fe3+-siderophores transport systems, ATPase components